MLISWKLRVDGLVNVMDYFIAISYSEEGIRKYYTVLLHSRVTYYAQKLCAMCFKKLEEMIFLTKNDKHLKRDMFNLV